MSETIRTIFFPITSPPIQMFITAGAYDHHFDGCQSTTQTRENYRIVYEIDSPNPVNPWIKRLCQTDVRGNAFLVRLNKDGEEVSL